jgi:small conductance mechanosensitive channel
MDQTTLRIAMRVRPLQQWAVARELRRRIRERLDHDAAPAASITGGGLLPGAGVPPPTGGGAG